MSRGVNITPRGTRVRVIEYDITNRDTQSGSPIRLITTILDPDIASAANSPRPTTSAGSLNPASLRSKPANAAATGSCPTQP